MAWRLSMAKQGFSVVITVIEQRLVERLKRGLGTMVRTVKSYNGEVDDLAAQIMTLPAVWVTYGGSRIETMSNGQLYAIE